MRRSLTLRDGVTVGPHFDYGETMGEQSFDVLVDGVVSGRLARYASEPELPAIISDNIVSIDKSGQTRRRNRVWCLAELTRSLASFADRQWTTQGRGWPDAVLDDIRMAQETASQENDG
jgi:hypothetical protein